MFCCCTSLFLLFYIGLSIYNFLYSCHVVGILESLAADSKLAVCIHVIIFFSASFVEWHKWNTVFLLGLSWILSTDILHLMTYALQLCIMKTRFHMQMQPNVLKPLHRSKNLRPMVTSLAVWDSGLIKLFRQFLPV